MAIEKILLVEDQEKYRKVAEATFKEKDFIFTTNYDEARSAIKSVDAVISDVFFAQSKSGTSPELQARVLEAIKYGLVKKYVQQMSTRVKEEAGLEADDRLRKCFETIGYHQIGCSEAHNSSGHMAECVSRYVKAFGAKATGMLEEAIKDMIGTASERVIKDLFGGLDGYMKQAPENKPEEVIPETKASEIQEPIPNEQVPETEEELTQTEKEEENDALYEDSEEDEI